MMCLTGECQTLQAGLHLLGSQVAPRSSHVQSLWTKVTSVLLLVYVMEELCHMVR